MKIIALFLSYPIIFLLSLFFLSISHVYSDPGGATAPESENNRQAAEVYWDQARQYQADGDYPLALKYYQQGLKLWSDDQIIDRANRLESFLEIRGQSQSELVFDDHSSPSHSDESINTPRHIQLDHITGYLDSSDSDHRYPIEISHYGVLHIEVQSESSLSIWMQFFDDKMNRLGSTNASSHLELTREDLAPGSYFVQIIRSGGQGSYEIASVHEPTLFKNDIEPNNVKDESQPIELGQITQGLLGFVSSGALDSQDWFALETADFGALSINIRAEESLQLWIQLFDDAGNRIGNTSSSSTLELVRRDLAPGTYYLQLIRSAGYGGYEIIPEQTGSQFISDIEPNNTREEAQPIELEKVTQGLLGYVDKGVVDSQDWFEFETGGFGELHVTVEAEETLQLWMQLFDVDANRLGNTTSSSTLEMIRLDLAPGTYFAQLIRSGGHGGYSLIPEYRVSKFISDDEPNNTKDDAQAINTNRVTQGLLGYISKGAIDSQDWFSFETTTAADLSVSVAAEDSLQLWMQLFDVNGNRLGNTNSASNLSLIRPDLEPGVYYVQLIRSSGHGGYTLKFDSDGPGKASVTMLPTSVEIELTSAVTGESLSQDLSNKFHASESIEINYKSLSGRANDWITLIEKGRPDNEYAEWFYTQGKVDGSHRFKPLSQGNYELRVYHDWPAGGYQVQQRIDILVE